MNPSEIDILAQNVSKRKREIQLNITTRGLSSEINQGPLMIVNQKYP
jgi:hypothetical protein